MEAHNIGITDQGFNLRQLTPGLPQADAFKVLILQPVQAVRIGKVRLRPHETQMEQTLASAMDDLVEVVLLAAARFQP